MSEWIDPKDLPTTVASARGYFTDDVIAEFKENPGKYRKVPVGPQTAEKFKTEDPRGKGFDVHKVVKDSEKKTSKNGASYTKYNYDVYVAYKG